MRIMPWQAIIEDDPETGHFTASIAGLPITVDARSEADALRLVREALAFCLEEARKTGEVVPAAAGTAKVVPVDV